MSVSMLEASFQCEHKIWNNTVFADWRLSFYMFVPMFLYLVSNVSDDWNGKHRSSTSNTDFRTTGMGIAALPLTGMEITTLPLTGTALEIDQCPV